MKHLLICGLILLLVLSFSLWTAARVQDISQRTSAMLDQALRRAWAGDSDATRYMVHSAAEYWERQSPLLCIVIRHEQVDSVTGALSRLKASREQDDFFTTCAEILSDLEHMAEMELPLLRNIL